MIIYIVNIVILTFFGLIMRLLNEKGAIKNTKKLFVFVSITQLILLQSLRHNTVGTDILGYLRFYDYVANLDIIDLFSQRMEFGFVIILKILSSLNIDHQVFLAILSLLIHIPVGYVIYKYSKNEYISIITYITFGFYAASFCTLRQSLAYSITLLTIGSIKNKKLFKFIFLLALATTIHKSAIVFLPSYLLARVKYNKISIPIVFTTVVVIFFRREMIANFFINIFYDYYTIVSSNSHSWMLLSLAFVLLGIVFHKRFLKERDNILYFNLIILSVVMMLFATVTTNAMRIANFFNIYLVLYIPSLIESIKSKKNEAILFYSIFVFSIFIYILLLSRESGYGYVPYKFFWQY